MQNHNQRGVDGSDRSVSSSSPQRIQGPAKGPTTEAGRMKIQAKLQKKIEKEERRKARNRKKNQHKNDRTKTTKKNSTNRLDKAAKYFRELEEKERQQRQRTHRQSARSRANRAQPEFNNEPKEVLQTEKKNGTLEACLEQKNYTDLVQVFFETLSSAANPSSLYRKYSLLFHPDKHHQDDANHFTEVFKSLQQAYERSMILKWTVFSTLSVDFSLLFV